MSNIKIKNKEKVAKIIFGIAILGEILCAGIIFFDIYSGKSTFSDQSTNILALIAVMIYGLYVYKSKDRKIK